ncbi:MAG: hypothetical protein ACK5LK_09660 [Chthoniobacterales bacterium]
MPLKNICLCFIILSSLVGVLLYSGIIGSHTRPTEASLRNVNGIEIQTKNIHRSDQSLSVDCQLKNQSERNAYSVAFTVRILAANGDLIAANPLGNVLDLKPETTQSITIPIPVSAAQELPENIQANAEVNLVRWDDAE